MDNCDLEKLSVSGANLNPKFSPAATEYNVTVESSVNEVTLDVLTSDSGASYAVLSGDGSKTIQLVDGVNTVQIEVVAEDGTTKKYRLAIDKLSAGTAELSDLAVTGDLPLSPGFERHIHEYACMVPFHCNAVTLLPKLPDSNMKAVVNSEAGSQPVQLNVGDTAVQIQVHSADGSNTQVYTVMVTRELIPMAVTFVEEKEQMAFECPLTLNPFYRPVSILSSEPKHVFSAPYIEFMANLSDVDPLDEHTLAADWKVPEPELDGELSAALAKCFFAYRGCDSVMKLSEVGSHSLECPHKPTGELAAKDVTESDWYKEHFSSFGGLEIETKHTVEVRSWEKNLLQMAVGEENVDKLCDLAQENLLAYRKFLPRPGYKFNLRHSQDPLASLEQAAVHYASAIKLQPKQSTLHLQLGFTLEEQHYALKMYGLKKKVQERDELNEALSSSETDDILALCKLHGFHGTPTVEDQLQAMLKEYNQLKDQREPARTEYVQRLISCVSEKAGKIKGKSFKVSDNKNYVHRALMKYLDAWSLNRDSWEPYLHAGRLLLLQGKTKAKEALQHLQTGLAMLPSQPALRFYTAQALLQQGVSEETERQAALFLHQGLEYFISQSCSRSPVQWNLWDPLSPLNAHFLQGLTTLGQLLREKNVLTENAMSAEQVYRTAVVLAGQALIGCAQGEMMEREFQWVLLEGHFALFQEPIQRSRPCQGDTDTERQALVVKRCKAVLAFIRESSLGGEQEGLEMKLKVCHMCVAMSPRDSHALYLLGQAQISQAERDPKSSLSEVALQEACQSLRASMALENEPQSGEPLPFLTNQQWWQARVEAEKQKDARPTESPAGLSDTNAVAGKGAGRGAPGRGKAVAGTGAKATAPAPATAPTRGAKAAAAPAKPPAAARGQAKAVGKPGQAAKAPCDPSPETQPCPDKPKPDCSESCPGPARTAEEPGTSSTLPGPLNRPFCPTRLLLASIMSNSDETFDEACRLYEEVIAMEPKHHYAYICLASLLDRKGALEVFCRVPLRPVAEQDFNDAFITGEILDKLVKLNLFDHPQLLPNLVAHAKVLGLEFVEKYIEVLEEYSLTKLLKRFYAMFHGKAEDDKELQAFFTYKGWM